MRADLTALLTETTGRRVASPGPPTLCSSERNIALRTAWDRSPWK